MDNVLQKAIQTQIEQYIMNNQNTSSSSQALSGSSSQALSGSSNQGHRT